MSTTQPSFITGVDFVTSRRTTSRRPSTSTPMSSACPKGKQWGNMPAIEFQAGSLTIAVMDPTAFGQEFRPHSVPLAFQVDDVAAARDHLKASRA